MASRSFTDLKVWQMADGVYRDVYRLTETFPVHDRFELASQMRRSAQSVPSNITEGFNRCTTRDKTHFYTMALASNEELRSNLLAAKGLGKLLAFDSLWDRTDQVTRMLRSLIRKIRQEGSTAPDASP